MTEILEKILSVRNYYIIIFLLAFCFNLLRAAQIIYSKTTIWRKMFGYFLEYMHNLFISAIIVSISWLNLKSIFLGIYNLPAVVFINFAVLFAFFLFSYLRTCLFFLFFNRTLGFDDCGEYYSVVDFFRGSKIINHGKPDCEKNIEKWMKGIRIITLFVLLMDIVYLDHYWNLNRLVPP